MLCVVAVAAALASTYLLQDDRHRKCWKLVHIDLFIGYINLYVIFPPPISILEN